jgi:predicted Rossmann-fold nucleotide-binding protein
VAEALRVLVCGGRDYQDYLPAADALDRIAAKLGIAIIIQGGATGADDCARRWALNRGVECLSFPADWSMGRKAGPIRNQTMIDEGKPNAVVAFPGGRGTADMVKRAEAAGLPVWRPYG